MKMRRCVTVLLLLCALSPLALAQAPLEAQTSEPYAPRLADIMNAIQTRHMKLWYAGKALNWELAAFELRQLKAGLLEAAVMYPGIPVGNVTTMSLPMNAIADAVESRDSKRFSQAVGGLTKGCNGCHQSMERGFIAIQTPTLTPFGNQMFAPREKP